MKTLNVFGTHFLFTYQTDTKSDAAVDFVSTLKFIDVDTDEIKASSDHDPKLEEAVESVFEEEEDEDEYGG